MKVLVLEDTIAHQVRMENILSEIASELAIPIDVTTTGKIKEFKDYVASDSINQLYFLDIDIKGDSLQGLKMAQYIRFYNPYAIIVFVTTHSEFATLTFKYKVSALDFISKDINDQLFKEKVKEAIVYTKSMLIENTNMLDYFEYSYRGSSIRIPYNDIFYIETTGQSHKLRIVGKNFFKEFYGVLGEIIELDQEKQRFFSPHKSYLANIKNIVGYDKKTKEVIFYENRRCPVSRLKIKDLKKILLKVEEK